MSPETNGADWPNTDPPHIPRPRKSRKGKIALLLVLVGALAGMHFKGLLPFGAGDGDSSETGPENQVETPEDKSPPAPTHPEIVLRDKRIFIGEDARERDAVTRWMESAPVREKGVRLIIHGTARQIDLDWVRAEASRLEVDISEEDEQIHEPGPF